MRPRASWSGLYAITARLRTAMQADDATVDEVTRRLETVLARRDAVELERSLADAASGGWSVRWAPVLARLLGERWHAQHEDLANALQDLKEPGTIDALFAVACDAAPFNRVDDGRALARKCVWALHDIGTPAAVEKLELLATSAGDVATRGHAEKKLADLAARPADAPPAAYRIARDRNVRR